MKSRAKGSASMSTNPVVEDHRLRQVEDAVSSKAWQIATLLMPILLTTWLTFWVSQKENSIKQHIDTQSQFFQQQLQQQFQLSEDLYKRRFDAYEKIYTQLAQINEKLDSDERTAETKTTADNAAQLSELINLSKLHMSENVESLIWDAFYAASREDGPELAKRIDVLKNAMKKELDDWMLDKKLAPALMADAPSKPKHPKANASSSSSPDSKTRSPQ
jgi:hypothetical protein